MKLSSLLCDHMVLQQGVAVPLWGWDAPGQSVSVSIANQQATTVADSTGRWIVRLGPLPCGGPFDLKVTGSETKTVRDVFVGEVWLCSGQSNMQMQVRQCLHAEEDIAAAALPGIRFFNVAGAVAMKPKADVTGKWAPCSQEFAPRLSALAFQFGRNLHRELNVPIGLIHASSGDTPAEAWMSRHALEAEPECQPILQRWDRSFGDQPRSEEAFQEFHRQWLAALIDYGPKEGPWLKAAQEARKLGHSPPMRPVQPAGAGSKKSPTLLYNGMIAPLIPWAIRGVIWYQGETNAIQGRSQQYRNLFRALIRSWREAWGQGSFPFLFVQLANHVDVQGELPGEAWAELREAQLMALAEPNTAMAVAIEIGEADQIHPRDKRELGRRLSVAALAKAYGRKIECSGPICTGFEIDGNTIRLKFSHATGGLIRKNSETLNGFAIAGADRAFHAATARIEGEAVRVHSDLVPAPVAVRYGWADNPECNLYNTAGLAASPFRTDAWPCITADRL